MSLNVLINDVPDSVFTSKQSSLQKVRESVDEHKFLSNWETVEHDGWKLITTQDKHYWCEI